MAEGRLFRAVAGVGGATLVAMASFTPDEAVHHVASWLEAAGLTKIAELAKHIAVDRVVLVVGASLIVWAITVTVLQAMGYRKYARRRLSQRQKRVIARSLKDSGWTGTQVQISYVEIREDCLDYALDFADALHLAGWVGEPGTTLGHRVSLTGLKIHVEDQSTRPLVATQLALALDAARVPYEWQDWPDIRTGQTILYIYRERRRWGR